MKVIEEIAVISEISELICDAGSVMDTVLSLKYETGCMAFAFDKACFDETFFRLSSGVAGEVIQKFVNYGIRAAVFGDFSGYTSKPLRDFIYESNKGRHFGFLPSEEEAIEWLKGDTRSSMMSVYELLPQDKHDVSHIGELHQLTDKEIAPIIPELLEWVQDINWPVAMPVVEVLKEREELVFPLVLEIMQGNDEMWQYWISEYLVPSFTEEHRKTIKKITDQ